MQAAARCQWMPLKVLWQLHVTMQVEKMREEFKSKVRFIVMNSFSTSKDTTEHLQKEHGALLKEEWELVQNKSPKVDAKTMEPVQYKENPDQEWCVCILSDITCHVRRLLSHT